MVSYCKLAELAAEEVCGQALLVNDCALSISHVYAVLMGKGLCDTRLITAGINPCSDKNVHWS